jgi:hypothetical protein
MNSLAEESIGTSPPWSLAAADGRGQIEASRWTTCSGVGLSNPNQ